jgi:hypothetical protein
VLNGFRIGDPSPPENDLSGSGAPEERISSETITIMRRKTSAAKTRKIATIIIARDDESEL